MLIDEDKIVLDITERDEEAEVRLRVSRFECVEGHLPGPDHGFSLEVTYRRAGAEAEVYGCTFLTPDDALSAWLGVSDSVYRKTAAAILDACFGVIAWAYYQFYNPGAEMGFPILMMIARVGDGYCLTLGDHVAVPFNNENELFAILPPFGAEGERGYEDARAQLIEQFRDANARAL